MDQTFPVVGIGASAGGLSALESLFKAMPADTGMAFVVVQHLSPDFKSLMDDLLARHTRMPVRQATHEIEVSPNTIYLIPPKKLLTYRKGRLVLTDRDAEKTPELPIDLFLVSLANELKDRAVGIILSGTGSDGSRGVRAINEHGGMVIVQEPDSAQFDGMPRSAITTECYDFISRPEDIPEILGLPIQQRALITAQADMKNEEDSFAGSTTIFNVLRRAFGVDFSVYKKNTVQRRIIRRMVACKCSTLVDYGMYLTREPAEADNLYQDLLIGVTEFFRDSEVWTHLAEYILPGLFRDANPREVRVWCAGCATGEEVYSLSILLDEAVQQTNYAGKLTLFATDLHRGSLERAGAGLYPESSLVGVNPNRRQRYFLKDGPGMYRVLPELRSRVVFAPQNLINDPPFTKLDLVTCRNLLIYLEPGAQDRALRQMHYGLRKGGILVLGSSESIGALDLGFTTENSRLKIFRKHIDAVLPLELSPIPRVLRPVPALAAPVLQRLPVQMPRQLLRDYDTLLNRYLPTGVIINENRSVEHYFGDIDRYLRNRSGRSSHDFFDSLRADLSLALTTLLTQCVRESRSVAMRGIRLAPTAEEDSNTAQLVDLKVEPLPNESGAFVHYFVGISESRPCPQPLEPLEITMQLSDIDSNVGELMRQRIRDLETELNFTRENLQASIEELQTSNEELQATNEELLASNEELQSTNEELQSVNEELFTVNSEYDRKNQELKQLNDDHIALLNSMADIGIVYIDRQHRIRKFNPAIQTSFNLLEQDIGRPIEHISYLLEDQAELLQSIDEVLEDGVSRQSEIKTRSGRWLLKRIDAYRTSNGRLEGAILSFKDISEAKRAYDRLEMSMSVSRLVWWEWNVITGTFITHAAGWCILGYELECLYPTYDTWIRLTHPDDVEQVQESLNQHLRGETQIWVCEHRLKTKAGTWLWVLNQGTVILRSEEGKPMRMMGTTMDIHARKEAQERLKEEFRENQILKEKAERAAEQANILAREAQAASRAKSQFLAVMSHELRTPLNPIIGFADLLASTSTDLEARQYAKVISTAGENLLSLIGDVLDYSRLDREGLDIEQEPIDLVHLIDEVLALSPRKDGVRLRKAALDTLTPQSRAVRGDASRLRQVLLNLITNANKFTDEGSITLDCICLPNDGSSMRYRRYEFRVRDTGIGISPADHLRIFEPFVQADTGNTRKYGGSGLGLSICRSIVEAMDGSIRVESQLGAGATFIFELPMQQASMEEILNAEKTVPMTLVHRKSPRILLIEDNPDSRLVFEKVVSSLGCVATICSSGNEGIERLTKAAFDIVFMDLSMPDMDGFTTTRVIRSHPEIKGRPAIVALTGHSSIEVRRECVNAGMDDFFTKPFTTLKIARCLNRWAEEAYSKRPRKGVGEPESDLEPARESTGATASPFKLL